MTRIERVTSPLPRECSTTEPHGHRHGFADLGKTNKPLSTTSLQPIQNNRHPTTGAGDGNRTRVISLEGWSSTIELLPPGSLTSFFHCHLLGIESPDQPTTRIKKSVLPCFCPGGGGWIRTSVRVSGQIYSLLPLTTRPPLRGKPATIAQHFRRANSFLHSVAKAATKPGIHGRSRSRNHHSDQCTDQANTS
jgi:hypothetical protein